MTQSRTQTAYRVAVALALFAAASGAAIAQSEDPPLPRILMVPSDDEARLPGDRSGSAFGIIVRRGEGFLPPVEEEQPDDPQPEVRSEPDPVPFLVRRPRRRGY